MNKIIKYNKNISKIVEIGIASSKGSKIYNVNEVEAIKGKGLLNDRKFKEKNNIKNQVTLIEIEKIEHYNKMSESNIKAVDFRRNLVTKNIDLNNLVGKKFSIGEAKFKGHDLCYPCKYLQNKLNQKNFIKFLLKKGGLRCEILTSGKISVGDIIESEQ